MMMTLIFRREVNSQAAGLIHDNEVEKDKKTWRLASILEIPSRHHEKRAADARFLGCVFLPAAGNRNGSSVNNAGSNGNYWSSSPNGSNADNAYNVNFNSDNLNPADNNNRNNGFSVRLVRPVESTYPTYR